MRPLKLEILWFSKSISSAIFNVSWQMTSDHWFWNYGTMSNFCTEQIFDICPSFCVTWLRTWNGVTFIQFANAFSITFARWQQHLESTLSPCTGLIFLYMFWTCTSFSKRFTLSFTASHKIFDLVASASIIVQCLTQSPTSLHYLAPPGVGAGWGNYSFLKISLL